MGVFATSGPAPAIALRTGTMTTSRLGLPSLSDIAALVCLAVCAACGDTDPGSDAGASSTGSAGASDSDSAATADSASSVADGDDESGAGSGASTASSADSTQGGATDTGSTGGDGMPVELGTAGDFVILAMSGISTVPPSVVVGDLGVSPADSTYLTGFSLTMDASELFSTSRQVTGRLYAADYMPPTPAQMTTAIGDMMLAFDDAAGRPADVTELGAGSIGGMTLEPATYAWGTSLLMSTDVTLTGSATDVFIFQVAGDLVMESGTSVVLSGGALPENVFWQVAGLVDLGTTAHLEGVVLTRTAVTLRTGASVNGRLMAQTAVDIDQSTVVQP